MQILDGKKLSQISLENTRLKVEVFHEKTGRKPSLATLLVGDSPASQVYIRKKIQACEKIGLISRHFNLRSDISASELKSTLEKLNHDETVDGILLQLPLPKHLNDREFLDCIDPNKDVDGFHSKNVGNLVLGQPGFVSCTPAGIMFLLEKYDIDVAGKSCVVVGRSNIVGKPIAMLLLAQNATVTICHSRTQDLEAKVREAEVLVVAVGKPECISGSWIKKGATVIDVGINRLSNKKLVGDVEFKEASQQAAFITPVPGGVGPLTIAMLLKNTLIAAQRLENI